MGVILILVLILVGVAILLIRLCRKRIKAKKHAHLVPRPDDPKAVFGSHALSSSVANNAHNTLGSGAYSGTKGKVAPVPPAKMPKHIQMGTGFLNSSVSLSSSSAGNTVIEGVSPNGGSKPAISERPDLIPDPSVSGSSSSSAGDKRGGGSVGTMSSGSSRVSGSNPASVAGSYQLAMENIIDDYR